MSSIKLKLEDDFYFEETTVFGLVSEVPVYRLCYFLNEALNLKLKRCESDVKDDHKGQQVFFSRYEWSDVVKDVRWVLTSNKSMATEDTLSEELLLSNITTVVTLLPEFKKIDYFLHYEGDQSGKTNSMVKHRLQQIKYIRTFEELDPYANSKVRNLLIY